MDKRGMTVLVVVLAVAIYMIATQQPKAIILSPVPGTTVGPNFEITGRAPSDWFENDLTTVVVITKDGSILSSGGAGVVKKTAANGMIEFSLWVQLLGPGDTTGPYDGMATITVEPQYQDVLTQIGDMHDTEDIDVRLKRNTIRSSKELTLSVVLRSTP
jgi:hypothetical protein